MVLCTSADNLEKCISYHIREPGTDYGFQPSLKRDGPGAWWQESGDYKVESPPGHRSKLPKSELDLGKQPGLVPN